ncbi:hypothetical protein BX257_8981 [Streptomyces sp. 3212.3]|jgi:hypothetical protein|nr:hypothetical protein BX257_8981 [Streptomyces sp. 3212.3]
MHTATEDHPTGKPHSNPRSPRAIEQQLLKPFLDALGTVSDRLGIVAAAGNYQSQRSRNSAQMNPW